MRIFRRKPRKRYCNVHRQVELATVKWLAPGKVDGRSRKGWFCRLCGDKPAKPA